ncbi:hypothetical protein AgCh_021275 [Apium graveolens]
MLTPPMPSFTSIPFKWEEASGKAKIIDDVATNVRSSAVPKSQAVRCLVPPPMLMNIGTSKVTIMYKVLIRAVRLPTKVLAGKTPYEAWKGAKPNLQHIKLFGCVAFMKIPHVHVKKLDDRSKSVVYLGKEPETKANRLFDLVSGSIHVSRDVVS